MDDPALAEFVAALDPINAIAERTPGFIWRLTDEDGQPSSYVDIPGSDDPLVIINFSIWADLDSLKRFMYKTEHVSYLRRRTEWFESLDQPTSAAWWIPAGAIPSVGEAFRRVTYLQTNGPTGKAWPLTDPWPRPEL